MSFPGSLDDLHTAIPVGGSDHTQHHRDLAAAVEAVETFALGAVRLLDLGVITVADLLDGPVAVAGAGEKVLGAWISDPVALDISGSSGIYILPDGLATYADFGGANGAPIHWARMDSDGTVYGARWPTSGGAAQSPFNLVGASVYLIEPSGGPVAGAYATGHDYNQYDAVVAEGHLWEGSADGTSGGSVPDFAGNIGGPVADNGITWTDVGVVPTVGSVHVYALVATPVAP